MSFYGNVTYYLSNAFQKIVYRNAGSKYTSTTGEQSNGYSDGPNQMPAYEYILNPRNGSDSAILETGNKWLQFADPDGTIGQNQIKIFHKISEENAGTAQIDGTIEFGSTIGIPAITFDEAGHITNVTSQNFTLPQNPGALDLDSLKGRVAALESLVTGMHDDSGGTTIPTIPEGGSVEGQLADIYNKINEWDLKNGYRDDLKEKDGIGTVLHEVMVFLGLRARGTYTEDGQEKVGYLNTESMTTDPSSLVFRLNLALNYGQSTWVAARSNRQAVRTLADLVLDQNAAREYKDQYYMFPEDPTQ